MKRLQFHVVGFVVVLCIGAVNGLQAQQEPLPVQQNATAQALPPAPQTPAAPPEIVRDPREPVPYLTYARRNDSKPGDYKIVTVPAITPRQAMIDAQTYHVGWTAIESRMGQSRVMYNVLLKKREPYVPGMPRIPRPIPKERR